MHINSHNERLLLFKFANHVSCGSRRGGDGGGAILELEYKKEHVFNVQESKIFKYDAYV